MKRPRIALWIKQQHRKTAWYYPPLPFAWVPDWLARWAVRRVDRWQEGSLFTIGEETTLGKIVEIDHDKKTITVE